MKRIKEVFGSNKDKGLTLIELIVAIAVLAIASSILFSSYTNIMEEQRKDADMSALNKIDTCIKQTLMYNEAFEEVDDYVYDNNKMDIRFPITTKTDGSDCYIELAEATINGETLLFKDYCDTFYEYFVEHYGTSRIVLTSSTYKQGYYEIYIEFNGAKVSEIRDYEISNDSIVITNSGDTEIFQHD